MARATLIRSVEDMLIAAIVLISAALVAYTAGVWAEHRAGRLRPLHAVLFGTGLAFDSTGTFLMSKLAAAGTYASDGLAGTLSTVMAITGAAALILMGLHLLWTLGVLLKGSDAARRVFHRFSLTVWVIWLVPYFTGMASAMVR